MHRHGRICSLFSNAVQLPKLDVTGSSPVSRSMFSMTWEDPKITRYSVYSVFLPTLLWIAGSLLNHLGLKELHCLDLLLQIAD